MLKSLLHSFRVIFKESIASRTVLRSLFNGVCFKGKRVEPMASLLDKYLVKSESSPILKSPNDKRDYKFIKLKNGLRVVLISDPVSGHDEDENGPESDEEMPQKGAAGERKRFKSEGQSSTSDAESEGSDMSGSDASESEGRQKEKMGAAALSISVGSVEDPEDIQGLAHLLEHAIFMGSEEYPEENGLDQFLSIHSGSSNATTNYERTTFEFEIPKKRLMEALKRFAHCFISPLLKKESIEKEISPVDSELLHGLLDDDCRYEQLTTVFAKEGHPMKKFTWGNRKSLSEDPAKAGIDVRERIVEFWRRYYVAENMTLVVQSQEGFETLQEWVDVFSRIPSHAVLKNKRKVAAEKCTTPFDEKAFRKVYHMKPIKNMHTLCINWSMPSLLTKYQTKPLTHWGSLVGHEGIGSLLSFLRKEGLALELAAGNDDTEFDHNRFHALFKVEVTLTESGVKNMGQVVKYIFAYLDVLKREGPQEWYFKEEQLIELNKVKWQDESCAINHVIAVSKNMFLYPLEHILIGHKLLFKYDAALTANCLKALEPKYAHFVVLSSLTAESEYDQTEKWMGIPYKVTDVPKEWLNWSETEPSLEKFKSQVHLPPRNEFIATDFSIVKDEVYVPYPIELVKNDYYRLWYKKDNQFNSPKACYYFALLSPVGRKSAVNAAALDLFLEVLSQNLSENVYPADLAGLYYMVNRTEIGLMIMLDGFNHKLAKLLHVIVDQIVNFSTDDQTFETVRKSLLRTYHNSLIDSERLGQSLRFSILEPVYWTALEKRAVLMDIDQGKLISVQKEFLGQLFIESLIQGNVSASGAKVVIEDLKAKLKFSPLAPEMMPRLVVNELPSSENHCRVSSFCANERNSFILNYYQVGPADIRTFCRLDLMSNYMYEPVFDTLRTKESLCYDVHSTYHDTCGVAGFSITVHSPANQFDCSFIDGRIEAFLQTFAKDVSNMKEETYSNLVSSRIKIKTAPDLHLREEARRNWDEIVSFNFCFDRLKREVGFLQEISLLEFKRWTLHHLLNYPLRKKLSIQVVANGKVAEDESKQNGDSETDVSETEKTLLYDVNSENSKPTNGQSEESVHQKGVNGELKEGTPEIVYALNFLRPVNEEGKHFIDNIETFKGPLKCCPVTVVNT